MRCETCGKEVPEVRRVVIYKDYDRTRAVALYNCLECFDKKERAKTYNQPQKRESGE